MLVIHFFGVYAPLVKRFSLPIRRVRGREARFVDSFFLRRPRVSVSYRMQGGTRYLLVVPWDSHATYSFCLGLFVLCDAQE